MRKKIKQDRYVNIRVGGTWYAMKLSKVIDLFNKGDIINKCSVEEPIDSLSREELQECLGREESQEFFELYPPRKIDPKKLPF